MEDIAYLPVLKRVGLVLLVIGLIDIGIFIYCTAKSISYHSIFNVFAAVAGILLIRGNLRAAETVLWFATFYLATFTSLLVAWPLLMPPGLALTEARLYPLWFSESSLFVIAVLVLLYWVIRQLRVESVLAARIRSGRKLRSSRQAAFTGVGLVAILGFFVSFSSNSARGTRAEATAAAQIGPGYKYHVTSIRVVTGRDGTDVSTVVTAWNNHEIRNVPVQWKEP